MPSYFLLLILQVAESLQLTSPLCSLLPAQGRKFRSDCSYMLLAGTSALFKCGSSSNSYKNQETHYEVSVPTGQEELDWF